MTMKTDMAVMNRALNMGGTVEFVPGRFAEPLGYLPEASRAKVVCIVDLDAAEGRGRSLNPVVGRGSTPAQALADAVRRLREDAEVDNAGFWGPG